MLKRFLFPLACFLAAVCVAEDVKLFLPETIYAVPGVEMNVYFQNIVTVINPANYVFDVDCPKGSNWLKRWSFVPEPFDVGTWPWKIRVIGQNGVVAEGETKLVVVPPDAGKGTNFTLFMVGASQTSAGVYPQRVAELMARPGNPALTTLGTRRHGDVFSEGYGGWHWRTFMTRWGIKGPNTMDGMHPKRSIRCNSVFLFPDPKDPSKGVFDLKQYFETKCGGKLPDAVTFQLGLNDILMASEDGIRERTATSLFWMEKMIGEFQKLQSKPQIFVFLHIPGANQDGFGQSYQCKQTSWQYRLKLDYYNRALLKKCKEMNLIPVPVYINIDTENNMKVREQDVNLDNPQKITRASNGVHPADAGYRQMGDTLYCWLKAAIWQKQSGK